MRKAIRLILCSAIWVFFAQSSAMAECDLDRLVNDWRLYMIPTANSWIACEIMILPGGKVNDASRCRGSNLANAPVRGEIKIEKCIITGYFSVRQRKYIIEDAGANVDRTQIHGIMKLPGGRHVEFKMITQ